MVGKVDLLLPFLRPVHPSRLSTMLDALGPVGSPRFGQIAVLLKSGEKGPNLPVLRLLLLHQPHHTTSLAILRRKRDIELDTLEPVNRRKRGNFGCAEGVGLVDLDLEGHFLDLGFGLQKVADLVFALESAQVPGQGEVVSPEAGLGLVKEEIGDLVEVVVYRVDDICCDLGYLVRRGLGLEMRWPGSGWVVDGAGLDALAGGRVDEVDGVDDGVGVPHSDLVLSSGLREYYYFDLTYVQSQTFVVVKRELPLSLLPSFLGPGRWCTYTDHCPHLISVVYSPDALEATPSSSPARVNRPNTSLVLPRNRSSSRIGSRSGGWRCRKECCSHQGS